MIVYQLTCENKHEFEGWFASTEACDRQTEAGQLECPTCGSAEIHKLPAAPYVKGSAQPAQDRAAMDSRVRAEALAMLRAFLVDGTEDVGRKFAEVARRIHYEEEEARGIRGRVTREEAEELEEEGIEAILIAPDVLPSGEVH
jgi:hypothetical protein